ncbi:MULTISPECIES: SDR family oxidoreductase [unclassified Micromonospora]|uniref:SDR family oxidoreductase n=1 Tax=unclassified Micromonospora TaxID=2617518 RepID=UPI0022B66617|nr:MULTISPECIES: SDR family oxidoreductase [unclassified Micromonospora]MCZ7418804.1 SDR family oxidoreductase [Verrucosispora sp. WMMA2121]WBB92500.1 SDR family oxidoreductase [Verrucosispora sp. WMMC514]
MRCLVTGATGYIGGRLAPRLLAEGYAVRCLARRANRLRDVPWAAQVEVVEGDLSRPESLAGVFDGVDVAYYLVHSLGQAGFEAADRQAATTFAEAARAAGVRRIVYLGGPEPAPDDAASAHLRSRAEVARILLDSGVPTVVLRAAVILGSGSASFEMLRYLTERLPVMVTPRWVSNRIQPIAVRDVLRYLVGCATLPPEVNRAFDIAGPDVLTFGDMMQRYARVAGLSRRLLLPVRPLTPTLSSYWVGLVTPVPNALARPLVESLVHEAVAHEHDIATYLPDPAGGLTGFDRAVELALAKVRDAEVETRWSNAAGADAPAEPLPSDPHWSGGTAYTDLREQTVAAPPEALWQVIEGVGGENGWYSFPLAWSVRGWLDRLVGGVGLRRGRRHPHQLRVGEALDFWRVEEIVPGELLRLRAEMRLPGRAWLEMRVQTDDAGQVSYRQRAVFLPRGLVGHAYWAAVTPFHAVVFGGMARNIAEGAERLAAAAPARGPAAG